MFGPKCWDVVTGEFVGDCQILDKLIKELLAEGFAEKRRSGWCSPTAKTHDYIHTASQRLSSRFVPLHLFEHFSQIRWMAIPIKSTHVPL